MKTSTWVGLGMMGGLLLAASKSNASGHSTARPPETGTEFFNRVSGMSPAQRDAEAIDAYRRGNVPSQAWITVPVSHGTVTGSIRVLADYFGVGTDDDWIRWPMTPRGAQRLVDEMGAILPTKRIAQAVMAGATKVDMPAYAPPHTVDMYLRSDRRVPKRPGVLLDGHKKYILAADRSHPRRVIIWGGWNYGAGTIWQPYSWIHSDAYVDYSHGVRPVLRTMEVNGQAVDILDVMMSENSRLIVSHPPAGSFSSYSPW